MENLIKSLGDEVTVTQEAVARMVNARRQGRRAQELEAEAEVTLQFSKVHARINELRRKLGL